MTDRFQREWINDQERRESEKQAIEKEKAKKKQTKTVTPAKVRLPKKQVLVDKDPKTLFKMTKFVRVGPKISCWRNEYQAADGGLTPLDDFNEMRGALEDERELERRDRNVRFVEA
jgi:hypothetical protein